MLSNAYARFAAVFAVAGTITLTTAHAAGEHVAPAMDFAKANISQWVANSHLIKAIQAQNVRHSVLTQSQIENLDRQWRAEIGADHRPLIEEILGRPVSIFLASIKKQHHGTVMEVFVMDNRGLNVAQSDVTSDYWQGDEAKFKKTYPAGPDAVFVDEVEMDESTQTFQSQVSMSIKDPATNAVIGAITVGLNVDAL
ncbi:MAG: hypothetical protein ACR2OX_02745 [Methyloligellaceae bacterium]